MQVTYDFVAKRIDHSLLGPTLTDSDLADGCRLAAAYRVASVCIKPYAVRMAAEILKGSGVAVGTTIGFPHGGHLTSVKLFDLPDTHCDGVAKLLLNDVTACGDEKDCLGLVGVSSRVKSVEFTK